jgi:hypothetical protein
MAASIADGTTELVQSSKGWEHQDCVRARGGIRKSPEPPLLCRAARFSYVGGSDAPHPIVEVAAKVVG